MKAFNVIFKQEKSMFSIHTASGECLTIRSPANSDSKPFTLLAALLMSGLLFNQPASAQSQGESGTNQFITGGDNRAAQKVWDASLKGTYIITPDHLKGRKNIAFIGPTR